MPTQAGQLVVTEFLANPQGVEADTIEWIELYNADDQPHGLAGCEWVDDGSDAGQPAGQLVIEPGTYAVFTEGPAAWAQALAHESYSAYTLGNGDDEIVLRCAGVVIDRVVYGTGWPLTEGSATQLGLNPAMLADESGNDAAADWCKASSPGPDGNNGSPGQANPPCP